MSTKYDPPSYVNLYPEVKSLRNSGFHQRETHDACRQGLRLKRNALRPVSDANYICSGLHRQTDAKEAGQHCGRGVWNGAVLTAVFMRSPFLWNIMPWSLLNIKRRFGVTYCFHPHGLRVSHTRKHHEAGSKHSLLASYLSYSSTLWMEAAFYSARLINFRRTSRRCIPEDSSFHLPRFPFLIFGASVCGFLSYRSFSLPHLSINHQSSIHSLYYISCFIFHFNTFFLCHSLAATSPSSAELRLMGIFFYTHWQQCWSTLLSH
jgi:hypothetical protein